MTDQKMQILEPKTEGDIATRPPVRPFTRKTGIQKVRATEDCCNCRDPEKVL